ncbi:unnamed protein product [Peronospora belbahrii]|uniref:TPX2 C-terminal domain-containing protein n=1 Tax=Peronospora belbahrii TaxID=622444 RepID=A0ABN8CW61_9STRA|nr:unnamed protein product [Peronospora belbahrii]
MKQQVAELSTTLSGDVKTTGALLFEPEPQLDTSVHINDVNNKSKKKKNRRKSLEKKDVDNLKEELKIKEEEEKEREKIKEEEKERNDAMEDVVTVSTETSITKKNVVIVEDTQENVTTSDESRPLSVETTSSLGTRKLSGSWGSLLSRLKPGRKKSLSNGTESATKMGMVKSSLVEPNDDKRLEMPEEKIVDELLMNLKISCGDGEQSVRAEKDKYDVMKEQKKKVMDATQSPSPSPTSRDGVLSEEEVEKSEVVNGVMHLSSTERVDSNGQELDRNKSADLTADVTSEGFMENTGEDDGTVVPAVMDKNIPLVSVVEVAKHDTLATLEVNECNNEQVGTAEVESENVAMSAEVTTAESIERNQCSADVVTIEPVPLKLDFNFDLNTEDMMQSQAEVVTKSVDLDEDAVENIVVEADTTVTAVASSDNSQSKTVAVEPLVAVGVNGAVPSNTAQNDAVLSVTDDTVAKTLMVEPDKLVESNESLQSKAISTYKTELLPVKVAQPASEQLDKDTAPSKPEKVSPVKSLASRFEGKQVQSLDSLKFRTLRGFFPEECSIRVEAEKKKYEAQAEQQKLKAKAEEEAKAKYKVGTGFKSPEKNALRDTSSLEVKKSAVTVQDSEVIGGMCTDSVGFATPDTVASRKKFSHDEGYAVTDSPSKLSDDAKESLTPVKSIASRFEGKHEQSLDDLKFRTVRGFFSEERSVHVESEKQKFEAQAQHDTPLDNLKFRTVRGFFADEGMRSIDVGAEKAKFEALRMEQEEETKVGEHATSKNTAHAFTTLKRESSVDASSFNALGKTPLSTLDEDCNEMTRGAMLSFIETESAAVIESAVDSAVCVALGGLSLDGEIGVTVDKFPKASDILPFTGSDAASTAAIIEDKFAVAGDQGQASEIVDAAKAESVFVGNDTDEASLESNEGTKFSQEAGKVVSPANTQVVRLDLGDGGRNREVDITEGSHAYKNSSLDFEQNVKRGEYIESKIEVGLDKPSYGEDVVKRPVDSIGGAIEKDDAGDQLNMFQVAENEAANSELVELDLGSKAVESVEVVSTVSATGEVTERDAVSENESMQQLASTNEAGIGSQNQVFESAFSVENRLEKLYLGESTGDALKEQLNHVTSMNCRPMLTTERSFVMEDDHTVETVETVVVGERSMTNGEEDLELLSPTKVRPAHKLFSGITSSKSTKALSKKILAKASAAKAAPAERAPVTSLAASYATKRAAKTNGLHKPLPQEKKAVYTRKGNVSELGCIKFSPAAPTIPAPTEQASIIAHNTSSQLRNVSDDAGDISHSRPALTADVSKSKGAMGSTCCKKSSPPLPTGPVTPKRASIVAPTALVKAKKAAEPLEDTGVTVPSVPARSKKYLNVKSKVLTQIQSGSMQPVTHKTITKEDFIAAERRKSLGSGGVRSLLRASDRRASLAARATIVGPPEPFVRSAFSRQKLRSTLPRYLDYENTPGYVERARQQYERRKRLEKENAAKSEKRQRELRTFFADKQHKSLVSSAEEVRGAYEFEKVARESKFAGKRTLRTERQRSRPTRRFRQSLSATSSAGTSSSNGVPSLTSKKSSVSSIAEKAVTAFAPGAAVTDSEKMTECALLPDETVELTQEEIRT